MRALLTLSAASLLVSIAACAPEVQPSSARPVSSDTRSSQGMPQPPGSLPPGDVVNAPITPRAGNVDTTRMPPRRGY